MSPLRRGQTLVVFAFTMLVLVIMVLMTIGLGMRIHERQEQQIVADAAAYSEAVATARAFNATATLNRSIIAQMAAVAAAQSMLSYGGFYHGVLNQARDTLAAFNLPPGCEAYQSQVNEAYQEIITEDHKLITKWEPQGGGYHGSGGMDSESGHYVADTLHRMAIEMSEDQRELYRRFDQDVAPTEGYGIADRVAEKARQGSPWGDQPEELSAPKQLVTRRERNDVVREEQRDPDHMVRATMATRGVDNFVSSRQSQHNEWSGAQYIENRINALIDSPNIVASLRAAGTSYFGDDGPRETEGIDSTVDKFGKWRKVWETADNSSLEYTGAWAQDLGYFSFTLTAPAPCNVTRGNDSFGYIHSTDPDEHSDNHMWMRGMAIDYRELNDPNGRVTEMPPDRHSMRNVPSGDGVSIWPIFVDYRESAFGPGARVNIDGQPKSVVPIVRNYAARAGGTPDPWEMEFAFELGNQAPGALSLKSDRGFRRSVAIASGLTYYHRGDPSGRGFEGHAREPPNFLNPFWRATLAASDIDEPNAPCTSVPAGDPCRGKAVLDTLDDLNFNNHRNAAERLLAAGFKALP